MFRLACVPIFLWLILTYQDNWALVVLILSGISDYLDGKIARRYNLVTRVGQLLDPLADRLYILSTLLGTDTEHCQFISLARLPRSTFCSLFP